MTAVKLVQDAITGAVMYLPLSEAELAEADARRAAAQAQAEAERAAADKAEAERAALAAAIQAMPDAAAIANAKDFAELQRLTVQLYAVVAGLAARSGVV